MAAIEQAFGTDDIAIILQKWNQTKGREKLLEMEMQDKQDQMAESQNYITEL